MNRLRCERCGDVIGAYEPVHVIVDGESVHRGSRASLGAHLQAPGASALHEGCYLRAAPAGDPADPPA